MFLIERGRLARWCLVAAALAVVVAPALGGGQSPGPSAADPTRTVRLTAAEAARLAKEARESVSVQMAPGLELALWAPEQFVVDPVALDLDEQGTLYATSTSRNNLPLDIRQHPTWFITAHTLKTVEDLRKFYERELAPERSAENPWLPDLNKDGSRDWRDFGEVKERVYRIRDTDGDGLADVSQIMIEGFSEDPTYDIAGGLLYHEGDLYLGVPPALFRLRDENGDGAIDSKVTISEGYNIHPAFGGHGISGVTLGPDGRLYWEVGDMGLHVVDKAGRRWSYPNQGAVLRANPDGTGFEVFATGIRNLQEFAFDEYGNLISVDNDGDHVGETERLVYIPEGSDSGWRSHWQYGKYTDPANNRYNVWMDESMFKPRFEGQAAHIVPPVAAYHTGPAGFAYNPGTALSDEWRNHFFLASFPGAAARARIYAFELEPQGAGFALKNEKVLLQGILTVGMKFGPDGALYLADWITGWDSKNAGRIWKLDAPAGASSPLRAQVRTLLAENFRPKPAAALATLLSHADMRVRMKAQHELARRSDGRTLRAIARPKAGDAGAGKPRQLSRIHGLWGLGQLARQNRQRAALLPPFLADADPELRAQAAKLLGDVKYAPAAGTLTRLLADASPRARYFAAEALGRIGHKPAVAPIVAMLAANNDVDVYLRHAGAVALARIGDAPSLAALSTHASRAVRLAAIVALRRMGHADVSRFLADGDEIVVVEAARAINDDGGIDAAVPALARVLAEKRFTREPLLRRAISANLRLGTADAIERLAAFAADRSRPDALRADAVAALGVWPSPSVLDRVDGALLKPTAQQRDAASARAAVLRLIETLPAPENSDAMKIALADAAGRLDVEAAAPVFVKQLQGDPSAEVRRAALGALQAMNTGDMSAVMRTALADRDPGVRRSALAILPKLAIAESAKVDHLASVIKAGSFQDQQGAIEVLAGLDGPEAERLLGTLVDELTAGRVAAEIQLDVVDAVEASGIAALRAKLDAHRAAASPANPMNAFRGALLRGGSAMRGRQVLLGHAAAACIRCHSIKESGAAVGPDLAGVGARLSREQLLESLLEPNARIAPGYGTVLVTLRTGASLVGTLREETETHLVIQTSDAGERRIAKTDIEQRGNATSAMPPMGALLKPREIRDLVEFLTTLR